jgi:hypothetical protein
MRERTTRRSIYPQGHLSGLFRTLRDGGVDLDRFIMSVDLDDPYFGGDVKVISRADFAGGLSVRSVRLNYAGNPKNVLDPNATSADLQWASNLITGPCRETWLSVTR